MGETRLPAGWRARETLRVVVDGEDGDGAGGGSVSRLLGRMRQSAFQGRKLGEAFEVWRRMIDGGQLIALGLAGSLASAGLTPLVRWLVERGYVDLISATSANATEDLLESRGVPFYQVDPDRVDDEALRQAGFYRFYDHVVRAADYDAMEDFTAGFFEHLDRSWPRPSISGVHFMLELGRWLRSEEHTSELQSRENLVCRLLLEKKKKKNGEVYTDSSSEYMCSCYIILVIYYIIRLCVFDG